MMTNQLASRGFVCLTCLQVAVVAVHVITVHATANEKICLVCGSLDLAKSNSENGLGMYSHAM